MKCVYSELAEIRDSWKSLLETPPVGASDGISSNYNYVSILWIGGF